ncbi:MAG: threonine/serine exporter family protein [Faecalibacillus sp.]
MNTVIQCLAAFSGCLGFSFVFRIHNNFRFALTGSIGGTLGWIVYLLLEKQAGTIISSMFAMMVVAFFSEIMARIYKAPATIFVVVGCFPLVPGKGIYQTMLYLISNNRDMFINSLLETVGIALALATALLIISTIFKIRKNIKNVGHLS